MRYWRCSSVTGAPLISRNGSGKELILVNVSLITLRRFELGHPLLGVVCVQTSSRLRDLVQGGVDVLGHTRGVTADIEVRAVLEPGPELRGAFQHSMLNVNFLRLVARECQVEFGQMSAREPCGQLLFVKIICL